MEDKLFLLSIGAILFLTGINQGTSASVTAMAFPGTNKWYGIVGTTDEEDSEQWGKTQEKTFKEKKGDSQREGSSSSGSGEGSGLLHEKITSKGESDLQNIHLKRLKSRKLGLRRQRNHDAKAYTRVQTDTNGIIQNAVAETLKENNTPPPPGMPIPVSQTGTTGSQSTNQASSQTNTQAVSVPVFPGQPNTITSSSTTNSNSAHASSSANVGYGPQNLMIYSPRNQDEKVVMVLKTYNVSSPSNGWSTNVNFGNSGDHVQISSSNTANGTVDANGTLVNPMNLPGNTNAVPQGNNEMNVLPNIQPTFYGGNNSKPQGQPQGQSQGEPQGQPQSEQQSQTQGQPQGQPQGQTQGQQQGQAQGQPQGQPQGQQQRPPLAPTSPGSNSAAPPQSATPTADVSQGKKPTGAGVQTSKPTGGNVPVTNNNPTSVYGPQGRTPTNLPDHVSQPMNPTVGFQTHMSRPTVASPQGMTNLHNMNPTVSQLLGGNSARTQLPIASSHQERSESSPTAGQSQRAGPTFVQSQFQAIILTGLPSQRVNPTGSQTQKVYPIPNQILSANSSPAQGLNPMKLQSQSIEPVVVQTAGGKVLIISNTTYEIGGQGTSDIDNNEGLANTGSRIMETRPIPTPFQLFQEGGVSSAKPLTSGPTKAATPGSTQTASSNGTPSPSAGQWAPTYSLLKSIHSEMQNPTNKDTDQENAKASINVTRVLIQGGRGQKKKAKHDPSAPPIPIIDKGEPMNDPMDASTPSELVTPTSGQPFGSSPTEVGTVGPTDPQENIPTSSRLVDGHPVDIQSSSSLKLDKDLAYNVIHVLDGNQPFNETSILAIPGNTNGETLPTDIDDLLPIDIDNTEKNGKIRKKDPYSTPAKDNKPKKDPKELPPKKPTEPMRTQATPDPFGGVKDAILSVDISQLRPGQLLSLRLPNSQTSDIFKVKDIKTKDAVSAYTSNLDFDSRYLHFKALRPDKKHLLYAIIEKVKKNKKYANAMKSIFSIGSRRSGRTNIENPKLILKSSDKRAMLIELPTKTILRSYTNDELERRDEKALSKMLQESIGNVKVSSAKSYKSMYNPEMAFDTIRSDIKVEPPKNEKPHKKGIISRIKKYNKKDRKLLKRKIIKSVRKNKVNTLRKHKHAKDVGASKKTDGTFKLTVEVADDKEKPEKEETAKEESEERKPKKEIDEPNSEDESLDSDPLFGKKKKLTFKGKFTDGKSKEDKSEEEKSTSHTPQNNNNANPMVNNTAPMQGNNMANNKPPMQMPPQGNNMVNNTAPMQGNTLVNNNPPMQMPPQGNNMVNNTVQTQISPSVNTTNVVIEDEKGDTLYKGPVDIAALNNTIVNRPAAGGENVTHYQLQKAGYKIHTEADPIEVAIINQGLQHAIPAAKKASLFQVRRKYDSRNSNSLARSKRSLDENDLVGKRKQEDTKGTKRTEGTFKIELKLSEDKTKKEKEEKEKKIEKENSDEEYSDDESNPKLEDKKKKMTFKGTFTDGKGKKKEEKEGEDKQFKETNREQPVQGQSNEKVTNVIIKGENGNIVYKGPVDVAALNKTLSDNGGNRTGFQLLKSGYKVTEENPDELAIINEGLKQVNGIGRANISSFKLGRYNKKGNRSHEKIIYPIRVAKHDQVDGKASKKTEGTFSLELKVSDDTKDDKKKEEETDKEKSGKEKSDEQAKTSSVLEDKGKKMTFKGTFTDGKKKMKEEEKEDSKNKKEKKVESKENEFAKTKFEQSQQAPGTGKSSNVTIADEKGNVLYKGPVDVSALNKTIADSDKNVKSPQPQQSSYHPLPDSDSGEIAILNQALHSSYPGVDDVLFDQGSKRRGKRSTYTDNIPVFIVDDNQLDKQATKKTDGTFKLTVEVADKIKEEKEKTEEKVKKEESDQIKAEEEANSFATMENDGKEMTFKGKFTDGKKPKEDSEKKENSDKKKEKQKEGNEEEEEKEEEEEEEGEGEGGKKKKKKEKKKEKKGEEKKEEEKEKEKEEKEKEREKEKVKKEKEKEEVEKEQEESDDVIIQQATQGQTTHVIIEDERGNLLYQGPVDIMALNKTIASREGKNNYRLLKSGYKLVKQDNDGEANQLQGPQNDIPVATSSQGPNSGHIHSDDIQSQVNGNKDDANTIRASTSIGNESNNPENHLYSVDITANGNLLQGESSNIMQKESDEHHNDDQHHAQKYPTGNKPYDTSIANMNIIGLGLPDEGKVNGNLHLQESHQLGTLPPQSNPRPYRKMHPQIDIRASSNLNQLKESNLPPHSDSDSLTYHKGVTPPVRTGPDHNRPVHGYPYVDTTNSIMLSKAVNGAEDPLRPALNAIHASEVFKGSTVGSRPGLTERLSEPQEAKPPQSKASDGVSHLASIRNDKQLLSNINDSKNDDSQAKVVGTRPSRIFITNVSNGNTTVGGQIFQSGETYQYKHPKKPEGEYESLSHLVPHDDQIKIPTAAAAEDRKNGKESNKNSEKVMQVQIGRNVGVKEYEVLKLTRPRLKQLLMPNFKKLKNNTQQPQSPYEDDHEEPVGGSPKPRTETTKTDMDGPVTLTISGPFLDKLDTNQTENQSPALDPIYSDNPTQDSHTSKLQKAPITGQENVGTLAALTPVLNPDKNLSTALEGQQRQPGIHIPLKFEDKIFVGPGGKQLGSRPAGEAELQSEHSTAAMNVLLKRPEPEGPAFLVQSKNMSPLKISTNTPDGLDGSTMISVLSGPGQRIDCHAMPGESSLTLLRCGQNGKQADSKARDSFHDNSNTIHLPQNVVAQPHLPQQPMSEPDPTQSIMGAPALQMNDVPLTSSLQDPKERGYGTVTDPDTVHKINADIKEYLDKEMKDEKNMIQDLLIGTGTPRASLPDTRDEMEPLLPLGFQYYPGEEERNLYNLERSNQIYRAMETENTPSFSSHPHLTPHRMPLVHGPIADHSAAPHALHGGHVGHDKRLFTRSLTWRPLVPIFIAPFRPWRYRHLFTRSGPWLPHFISHIPCGFAKKSSTACRKTKSGDSKCHRCSEPDTRAMGEWEYLGRVLCSCPCCIECVDW